MYSFKNAISFNLPQSALTFFIVYFYSKVNVLLSIHLESERQLLLYALVVRLKTIPNQAAA